MELGERRRCGVAASGRKFASSLSDQARRRYIVTGYATPPLKIPIKPLNPTPETRNVEALNANRP
jgi:hypothetical protein